MSLTTPTFVMSAAKTFERCVVSRMQLSHGLVLLWAMALPVSAVAGSHGTLDDLIELNIEYAQLEAAIHDLSVPASTLGIERQRQLLGLEPGEAFPVPSGVAAPAPVDYEDLFNRNGPKVAALLLNQGLRIIRNPSGSCPVAQRVLSRLQDLERQRELAGASNESLFIAWNAVIPEVEARCITEAYDDCVASGSVQPFLAQASLALHTFQMLGMEAEFIEAINTRMKDCGNYDLEAVTHATNVIHYPFDAVYTSVVKSELRGKLELHFPSENDPKPRAPETISDLGAAYFLGVPAYEFPDIRCSGRHGERCFHKEWNSLASAFLPLKDFDVKYTGTRADFNANDTGHLLMPISISMQKYTPPGMTDDRLVVKIEPPALMIEVLRLELYLTEDDVAPQLFSKPLEGWTRHLGGDFVEFSVSITVHVSTKDRAGDPKTADETAQLFLRHRPRPMTPFPLSSLPDPRIRTPATGSNPAPSP